MKQVGRKYKSKPITRPRKTGRARRRREKTHRKRLVALGISEEAAGKMNARQMRRTLARPAQIGGKS